MAKPAIGKPKNVSAAHSGFFRLNKFFQKHFPGLWFYILNKSFKPIPMNSILYIVAVILIIGWALGVFVYSVTGLIHVLLIIALIAVILGLIRRPTAI